MNQESSFISFNRASILERFPGNIVGDREAMFLAVAETTLSQPARDALEKSATTLGWNRGVTYLFADAPALLSKADLFEAIEGLDPFCVVIVGAALCGLACEAFSQDVPSGKHFRLFGRDACAFDDLDGLLLTDAGKKRAWETLRSLPHATS